MVEAKSAVAGLVLILAEAFSGASEMPSSIAISSNSGDALRVYSALGAYIYDRPPCLPRLLSLPVSPIPSRTLLALTSTPLLPSRNSSHGSHSTRAWHRVESAPPRNAPPVPSIKPAGRPWPDVLHPPGSSPLPSRLPRIHWRPNERPHCSGRTGGRTNVGPIQGEIQQPDRSSRRHG